MKRLIATIAIIALVGVVLATPASSKNQKPLSGKMELTFLDVPCAEEGPFLTWAGTVVIDGATYGWADFLTAFSEDGKFVYFEEDWTIFTVYGNEPVSPAIAGDPTRVVLAGLNDGWRDGHEADRLTRANAKRRRLRKLLVHVRRIAVDENTQLKRIFREGLYAPTRRAMRLVAQRQGDAVAGAEKPLQHFDLDRPAPRTHVIFDVVAELQVGAV